MSNSVLRISEAASLALHTMAFLTAHSARHFSAKEIATEIHCSEAHLSKVLRRLTRVGLLASVRGPGGGFLLSKPPQDIRLLDVYEAIEGPLPPARCLLTTPVCGGNCILGGLVQTLNQQVRDYLARTRLCDLGGAFTRQQP